MPPLPTQPILRRRWKAVVAGLSLLAVLAVGGIACFLKFGDYPGAWYSTYPAADGDWALTRKARTAKPLIDALHHYHDRHGKFPANVSQLAPLLPAGAVNGAGQNVGGWLYRPSAASDTFDASLRLGWDPSLVYHGTATAGTWAFEPGDGDPERPVVLHP